VSHVYFYKNHQFLVGKHNGTKVCLRRKKTNYKVRFNVHYGMHQSKMAIITCISLSRRYKTFVGLIRYSNGAVSSLPLFNGASIGRLIKVTPYIKNPKIFFFENFKAGYYVPIAYVLVMSCFFNITHSRSSSS